MKLFAAALITIWSGLALLHIKGLRDFVGVVLVAFGGLLTYIWLEHLGIGKPREKKPFIPPDDRI